jgi:hypothetical protein
MKILALEKEVPGASEDQFRDDILKAEARILAGRVGNVPACQTPPPSHPDKNAAAVSYASEETNR